MKDVSQNTNFKFDLTGLFEIHYVAYIRVCFSYVETRFVTWYRLGLILGLRPANERRRYYVTTSLVGLAQT